MSEKAPRQAKIDWLLAHADMWRGWPLGVHGGDARLWEIVAAMKKDGLFARSTYAPDVAMRSLINDARKQRRER